LTKAGGDIPTEWSCLQILGRLIEDLLNLGE